MAIQKSCPRYLQMCSIACIARLIFVKNSRKVLDSNAQSTCMTEYDIVDVNNVTSMISLYLRRYYSSERIIFVRT